MLYLVINNHSDSEIYFTTTNIKAVHGNQPIYIYTDMEFAQYLDRKKAKEMRSPSVSASPANGKLFALSYLTTAAEIAANYNNAKNEILRGKTIQPGEAHGGMIMLQKLNAAHTGRPLILRFKIGSDIHEIRFLITNRALL